MLMADDRSSGLPLEEGFAFNTEEEEEYGEDLSIEIGALLDILEEDNNPDDTYERQPEDLSSVHATQGSSMFITPYNDGPLNLPGASSGGSECVERPILSEDGILSTRLQLGSPVHKPSRSFTDGMPGYGYFCLDKDTVAQNVPTSSLQDGMEMRHEMDNGSFSVGCLDSYAAANSGSSNIDQYHNSDLQFTHSDAKYASENQLKKENELKVSMAAPRSEGYSGMEVDSVDDRLAGYADQLYSSSCGVDMADISYSDTFSFDLNFLDGDNKMGSTREENVVHLSHGENSKMDIDNLGGQVPYMAAGGLSHPYYYGQDYPSVSNVYSTYNGNVVKKETGVNKKEICASLPDKAVMMTMKSFGDAAGLSHSEDLKLSSFGSLTSSSSRKGDVLAIPESKRARLNFDGYDGNISGLPMARSLVHDHHRDTWDTKATVSSTVMYCANLNRANGSDVSNSDDQNYDTGDDADLCVLEDISGPAQLKFSRGNCMSTVATQPTMVHNSSSSISYGPSKPKPKANGDRHIFRAALQDLCQKLTEESPPEGFMTVPLLKHQRLALSWMVRKEKAVSCPGGILADDQGLGKTVSTISLILKERSSSSVESSRKPSQLETLDLDDDDDDSESVADVGKLNQGEESRQLNGVSSERRSTTAQTSRRIAAGTLIVCPTSVLRQWSDELQNKVSKKANLSVLTYHGSNRTKDPYELAKYDVVLTTYAIVSMEVPKKPLVDEDDEDSQMEFSSSKNRKYPPHSNKKSSKSKKSMEVNMQNIRPLAAVGWFRVVLDEAQSIKNHRTQVARACWGLRAKRRWCLSGTPMQNTVDDLYSYFRFLKFDPYSSYKAFCSEIKNPIQRSPSSGFRKLQAVLKTVMLRRTKGTFLDGEPIINLPPKTIKLHKVEFSPEERDFYQTLEADSRAQFAEYAAAGTVQKNYVNILLMLLRLRQACDHPLLVKGFSLDSKLISSVEMVKNIPRERKLHLLQLYHASGSICGICKDPPEDAVITSCGHIFCNQCICEHLSGDDSHCPTADCKRHLKGVAVFSVAALKCSVFDTSSTESTSDCSHRKVEDISEHPSPGSAYDSSKIKAALEVLQSLKPHDDTKTSSPSSVEEETLCKSVPGGNKKGKDELSRGSPGEKAIVFSQWTRMLDLLEDCLKKSSIQYRRLDGTMSVVARDKAVKDFNTLPEVTVMIMSLKAASLGLNMVAACHVLMLDLWWNPTTEDQAIDRAHRIGQTRPVTVLRLTVKDTVEDRILALQQKKREMVSSAFGDDEAGSKDSRLTVEDLNYLFS